MIFFHGCRAVGVLSASFRKSPQASPLWRWLGAAASHPSLRRAWPAVSGLSAAFSLQQGGTVRCLQCHQRHMPFLQRAQAQCRARVAQSAYQVYTRRTVLTANVYEWRPLPRGRLKIIENIGLGAEVGGLGSLRGRQEASGQTL